MDLSTDPTIEMLLSMLRSMTNASNSRDIFGEFIGRYGPIRSIDAFVGLVLEPAAPDTYRVTYAVTTKEVAAGRVSHTRDMRPESVARLPVRRGGILAELVRDGRPKMAYELPPVDDPIAGPIVAGMKSCMVLPIYRGEDIYEWTFAFSNLPEGVLQPRDVGQAAITANFLGAANRSVDMIAEINRLNEALRGQIDGIARVQQSLLPSTLPSIPGVRIASSYLTSDAAGGDYFDFFPLPQNHWGILIADVSGHGAAAATVMAMLHAIMHCYEPQDSAEQIDPAKTMQYANRRLHAAGLDGSFVTAFFAIFDPQRGELRYCNCGHNPPRLVVYGSGRIKPILDGATVPLGILDELPNAQTVSFKLQRGDTLVLYTDGITEAFDDHGEMLGEANFDQALQKCDGSPDSVIETVHASVYNHRKNRTRDDDQTIVAVQYVRDPLPKPKMHK